MEPVMNSTNIPIVVAAPWKIRSDGWWPGASFRGSRSSDGTAWGRVYSTVLIRTAR